MRGQFSDGVEGFTLPSVTAGQGFYAWAIDSSLLEAHAHGADTLNLTLLLAALATTGNGVTEVPMAGPRILVVSQGSTPASDVVSGTPGVPVVAIAVPVIVGAVSLGLLGFCVWSWRRHGRMPMLNRGPGRRRSGQGYGVRQSHSQRTAGATTARGAVGAGGIQLTPSDSWSPTSGTGNVFREELQRQDREAR